MADYSEVEECKWGVKNHLKDGVDGNENRTIFAISSGKIVPDQNLFTTMDELLAHLGFLERCALTIAIHLAIPTRIRPSRSAGLSGRNAHANPT